MRHISANLEDVEAVVRRNLELAWAGQVRLELGEVERLRVGHLGAMTCRISNMWFDH